MDSKNTSLAPADYRPPKSSEEILRRYQSGERYFRNTDLAEGSSLADAVLANSDFKGSFLSGIDFRRADLRQVCLDESNVKVSDFQSSDLRGASFKDSALCGAVFAGAKLDNVCVERATYYGAAITDIHQLAEVEPSK